MGHYDYYYVQAVANHYSTSNNNNICIKCNNIPLPNLINTISCLFLPCPPPDQSTLRPGQKKSLGIDDGFKGAGAACGSSVIRVAHQMVNLNRPFTRGFTVAHFDEADSELDLPETGAFQQASSVRGKSIEPAAGQVSIGEEAIIRSERNMMRRGSKSLPASPMGSPKAVRKNPYFTGIFTSAQNSSEHNR